MTCFHPIKAWQNNKADLTEPTLLYYKHKKISFNYIPGWTEIEIPCNHCLGCKLDHANMWATRITLESKNWKHNCFITLTYNDPHLPFSANGKTTLRKKDLVNFIKRLRYFEEGYQNWINPRTEKEEKPIRFFACGEYGTKGTRAKLGGNPHYHIACFNWRPNDLVPYKQNKYGDWSYTSKTLDKIWDGGNDNSLGNKRGFVVVEELNYHTACYIARYVQKKAGIASKKRKYTGKVTYTEEIDERNGEIYIKAHNELQKQELNQEPEFLDMSRDVGIGRLYWDKHKTEIKRNRGILLNIKGKVKLKQIPRYYKKLWEAEDYEEYYKFKYEKQKDFVVKKAEIVALFKLPDDEIYIDEWDFYLQSQEHILTQKAKNTLGRNNFI